MFGYKRLLDKLIYFDVMYLGYSFKNRGNMGSNIVFFCICIFLNICFIWKCVIYSLIIEVYIYIYL